MTTSRSKVIFKDAYYTVCSVSLDGSIVSLIVQSNSRQKGKLMKCSHPQFSGYLEGFLGDGDTQEKHDLAKVLYRE